MNEKDLKNKLMDMSILIDENILNMLNTRYNSKIEFELETIEKFECMVDDVNRLMNLIEFYDILIGLDIDKFLNLINSEKDEIKDILSDFLEYYFNVPLDIKLDKDKIIEGFLNERKD